MGLTNMIKQKSRSYVVLYYGLDETDRMILFLTYPEIFFLAGYFAGFTLDLYVVMSLGEEAVSGHGYCVRPFGNGSTRFVQPVQLATYS
jgi:hypothetical protein